MTAETRHDGASSAVNLDGTLDGDGTIDLAVVANTVTVEVTAEDTSITRTYTVTVTRAAPLSADASLSALSLSGVTLDPAFDTGTKTYTASVADSVSSTAVTAQTRHDGASAVVELDGTVDADGTVDLAEGPNTITVVVTAAGHHHDAHLHGDRHPGDARRLRQAGHSRLRRVDRGGQHLPHGRLV